MIRTLIRAVSWDGNRANNAKILQQQTGGEIIWDSQHNAYETFLQALEIQNNTDAIHLEDDVVLLTNWRERIESVIDNCPDVVCQFYQPNISGSGFKSGRLFLYGQCFYIPVRLVIPIQFELEFNRHRKLKMQFWDKALATALRKNNEMYWLNEPLVQNKNWISAKA